LSLVKLIFLHESASLVVGSAALRQGLLLLNGPVRRPVALSRPDRQGSR
jgi:hypothetical protein